MQSSRVREFIEVIAALGVIAGLFLVAYELRQNTLQMSSESNMVLYTSYQAVTISEIQSVISKLHAKSFENPEELTTEEILKLNSYYWLVITNQAMQLDLYDVGIIEYEGLGDIEWWADILFNSRFGRAWFSANRQLIDPRIVEVIDRKFESTSAPSKIPVVEEIESLLRLQRSSLVE